MTRWYPGRVPRALDVAHRRTLGWLASLGKPPVPPQVSIEEVVTGPGAVLRCLGREGVAELVERLCRHAAAFAEGLGTLPGVTVLNDVVFTQVCATFGSDERTQEVVRRLLADGTTWTTGSTWHGQSVLRIERGPGLPSRYESRPVPHTLSYAVGDNRLDIVTDSGATSSLWWATKNEWLGLAEVSGLEVEALYGGFDCQDFTEDSREYVFVTRRPSES